MQGFQMSRGGNGPPTITSVSGNLGAMSASTLITLAAPSNQIRVVNYSTSDRLYISFYGAATTNSFGIVPDNALVYDGPAISSFQLFSNSKSIDYGIFAV